MVYCTLPLCHPHLKILVQSFHFFCPWSFLSRELSLGATQKIPLLSLPLILSTFTQGVLQSSPAAVRERWQPCSTPAQARSGQGVASLGVIWEGTSQGFPRRRVRSWHLKGKVPHHTCSHGTGVWSGSHQARGVVLLPLVDVQTVTKSASTERGKNSAKMGRSYITCPGLNDLWMTPAFSQQCKSTGSKEQMCQEPVKPGDSFSDIKTFMSRSSAQIQLIVGHPSAAVLVGTHGRWGFPSYYWGNT